MVRNWQLASENAAIVYDQVQYAALPFKYGADGHLRFLLLTSRETRRWVIPKGWPMHGRKGREVAAQEAFEEAGLLGAIIGSYHYEKRLSPHHGVLCEVKVFLFHVECRLDDWPEQAEREAR